MTEREQGGWTEHGSVFHRAYFVKSSLVGPLSVCVSYPLEQSFYLDEVLDRFDRVVKCKRCFREDEEHDGECDCVACEKTRMGWVGKDKT